jgi:hypothetical protein
VIKTRSCLKLTTMGDTASRTTYLVYSDKRYLKHPNVFSGNKFSRISSPRTLQESASPLRVTYTTAVQKYTEAPVRILVDTARILGACDIPLNSSDCR